jgi:hypothetical protein
MADTVVHIGENSPEQVAYRLMHEIAAIEAKSFSRTPGPGYQSADRKWILETYAECLNAVRVPHARVATKGP